VLVNGGLNLSELDGWWAEAWTSDVGWAIGDGQEHGEDPAWDAAEAERLYSLLEQEIIPEFYRRDQAGIPAGWVARMRESMAHLTPAFSANRTVREYTENYYIPAAEAVLARSADGGKQGTDILNWRKLVADHWSRLRFDTLKIESDANRHTFQVQAYLDELDPEAIRIELYAEGHDGAQPSRETMQRGEALVGSNAYCYTAVVPADRPAADFTPRIIPWHPGAATPLEAHQILWYR
jgi:starch phosphorylase